MQEPQSSSTLNNYISGAQNNQDSSRHHHESSSSCVECQHIIKIEKHSSSDSDSASSSGDDGELVQPLHRHIIEHSRQIQATITHLQQQIQKLKSANSSKDLLIEQLKRQLKQVQINTKISQSMQQDAKQAEFLRRQRQIQNIRKQIYQKTQNFMNLNNVNSPLNPINELNDQNSINEELKRKLKKIEIKFEDRSKGSGNNQGTDQRNNNKRISAKGQNKIRPGTDSSFDDQEGQNRRKNKFRSSDREKRENRESSSTNQKAPQKAANKQRLPSRAPGRQNDFDLKESSIEQQLNEYCEKIRRLEKHIQFCEEEMLWMTNFIIVFLRMSQKMMISFNERVFKEDWNMKKKTKVAWRYTKHILSYLIP